MAIKYGYSMSKKSPIPIKFIINQSGAFDIIPDYLYKVAIDNITLADLEPKSIDEGIKNKTLIQSADARGILNFYNNYLEKKYSAEEIEQMIDENNNINYESNLYKEYYKKTKYFLTSYYLNETWKKNETIIPLLSEYGGNDNLISGIAQFKFISLLSEEYKFPVDIVYMRYGGHTLMDYKTQNSIDALRDMYIKVLSFAKLYLTSENYEDEMENKKMDAGGYNEPWNILYGYKYENISYAKNGIIENTFGINGTNYNKDIGNINNGENYKENEFNKYNLYIPLMAINKKYKHNGMIIFLHGADRSKEDMDYGCSRYAKLGYITACLDFSDIVVRTNSNAFEIVDDITSAIDDAKVILKNEFDFDVSKLEYAFFGFSLGSYLSMLYGYLMKEKLPVKFLINQSGYLDHLRQYFYGLKTGEKPLLDIEPETIDEAIENCTLINMIKNDLNTLIMLNNYMCRPFNNSQMMEIVDENNNTNYSSEAYQKFYNIAKYSLVSYYINNTNKEDLIPILCQYGGRDLSVGSAKFSLIRKLQKNVDLEQILFI